MMGLAVVALVLWVVVGFGGIALVWVGTVFTTATFALNEKPALAVGTIIVGIILALGALSLVVYNIVNSIINIVQIASGA